jgi:hypothetical protein
MYFQQQESSLINGSVCPGLQMQAELDLFKAQSAV